MIEHFLHAAITNKTTSKSKSNPLSGHSWVEETAVKNIFDVSGCGTSRSFKSAKAAKEYIQFCYDVKFGHLSEENLKINA